MRNKNHGSVESKSAMRRIFILLAAMITVIALAVTFAVGFDDTTTVHKSDAVGVATSSTRAHLTGDLSTSLNNGDIIEYSSVGSYKIDVLPAGSYKIEVYGAQGGGSAVAGGLGGYSIGLWEQTASNVAWVYVGGAGGTGSSSAGSGGFNGGANGGTGRSGNCGSGGGGASDVRIGGNALGNRKIVAGGGGGAGGGAQGGGSTVEMSNGGIPGTGGGSSGTAGAAGTSDASTTGSGGGAGGPSGGGGGGGSKTSSTSNTDRAYYPAGGGGGGGGYYGGGGGGGGGIRGGSMNYAGSSGGSGSSGSGGAGGAGASSGTAYYCGAGGGGGGGSGYIGGVTSGTVNGTTVNASTTAGQRSGNGFVRITVLNVNQPPATKNAVITLNGVRGSSTVTNITTSQIANDPDATKTALHFTNGTAGNLTQFSATPNEQLYLNSACTTLATSYLSWTWSGTQTLVINGYKRYPRSGKDGSTANGDLVLYAKVRDTFGTASQHAMSVIKFTVRFPKNTVALTSTGTNFVIGNSVNIPAPDNPAEASGIYNPNGAGKTTLFINKPLVIDQPHTPITAASLLTGTAISANYDMAVISIDSTANITGSSRKYKINEVDAGSNKVTAYTSALGTIPNAYSQLTLQCVSPDPNYQVLPVTVYTVEKTTAYGTSNPNAVPDIAAIPLQIVFKMENSRPILKSGVSNIVDLNVNQTLSLSLNTYFYDEDTKTTGISASTHTITGVVLPEHEFVLINKQKKIIAPAAPNAAYYNVGMTAGNSESGDAFTSTAQNAAAATGFAGKQHIVYNTTSPVSGTSREQAFMSFSYSGVTLSVTGHRSSFSQYASTRANAPGHFYILLHIRDLRDTADNGIWLPLAFTVGKNTSHTPKATVVDPDSAFTGQTKSGVYPYATGNAGQSFYFAPMAVSASGMNVIGERLDGGTLRSDDLQPLALDGDNFTTSSGAHSVTGKLNELLSLSDTSTAMLKSVVKSVCGDPDDANNHDYYAEGTDADGAYAENQYFRVRFIDVYYASSLFATATYDGGRVIVGSGTATDNGFKYVALGGPVDVGGQNYYVGKGLQITLRSATMNRYLYANVGISDTTGQSVSGGVNIAIRVNNTSPYAYRTGDAKVALYGDKTRSNAYSEYAYDPDNANVSARVTVPTVTYKIPLGASVIITPYDFAFDTQLGDGMTAAGVSSIANGFTLNGFDGSYDSANGEFKINAAAGANEESFEGMFAAAYSTSDYLSKITAMLGAANRRNTVGAVSAVANGMSYGVGIGASPVYNDRLFFMRTTRSADAFTYNPTSFNDFAISSTNIGGYLTQSFGSKVSVSGTSYNIDFMKLTAVHRTDSPAIINLSVCDRYDDSSDCVASFGVRIVIEVVNTRPHITDPSFYKELAASPIVSGDTVVTDTTFIFAADGRDGNGLMSDHDGDEPEFIPVLGTIIANTRDIADRLDLEAFYNDAGECIIDRRYLVDGEGNMLTDYMTAEIVSGKYMSVSALSSTKAVETGVFVYFFVTDRNGGMSIGYVQVEVINCAPRLNTSSVDGFDAVDPLWSIISTSETDIQRARYIVGAQSTKALVKTSLSQTAVDDDIKLLATDDDGRQSKVLLSQTQEDQVDGYRYINLELATATDARAAFELAVPSVKTSGQTDFKGNPASVVVFTSSSGGTTAGAPSNNYRAELMFYVGSRWYSRSALIDKLSTDYTLSTPLSQMSDYFDESGRFIVSDWALVLQATTGFDQSERCGIRLAVRDQAELGGDTAAKTTAYNSNRDKTTDGVLDNRVDVTGKLDVTVYQYISQTGIVSINDFMGKNGNYYTVEYQGKTYVPTYDGDVNSEYGASDNTNDIKYVTSGEDRTLVYPGDAGYDDATVIKQRATSAVDRTLAGTNAGVEYAADFRDARAFEYKDVIEIPSEVQTRLSSDNEHPEYVPVYVPMSYFGMMQTLATAAVENDQGVTIGSVVYPEQYVGYAVDGTFGRGDISNFASALTISDGKANWSGSTLNNNPYVNISAFYSHDGDNSAHYFLTDTYSAYSRPYYNNRLAVRTVDADGKLYGYENVAANKDNFIGDGKLMYLAEQGAKLKEHNFGLVFSKKSERTGVNNITLTIKLAKSEGDRNVAPNAAQGESEEDIKRTVTVKIHIQNSPIDLYDAPSSASGNVVKFESSADNTRGTYYVDMTMNSTESKSLALSRRSKATDAVETIRGYENAIKIPYFDDDYQSETYRDYAYFLSDSFNRLNSWNLGRTAYTRVSNVGSDDLLTNTSKFDCMIASESSNRYKAQKSVAHYFGATTIAGVDGVEPDYMPNGGMYGDGNAGFGKYFSASLLADGRVLTLSPLRKTTINQFALVRDLGSKPTPQAVIDYYERRGLVAEYDDGVDLNTASANALNPKRVYYPLKTLIYDSCGLGFTDASFVALEIRITITNGAPSLKNVGTEVEDPVTHKLGREFTLNLAVGNTVTINLYDIVYDPDIYTIGGNGLYSLATRLQFENEASGIDIETGDYLDSPLKYEFPAYQPNNCTRVATENGGYKYYRNGGGFSARGSTDRDVIMWMDIDGDSPEGEQIPASNNISFTVNRRTTGTYIDENSVSHNISINEYRFTLSFRDGDAAGAPTDFFTFVINITNQAPVLATEQRSFTMRAGDDITVLAAYYDVFNGTHYDTENGIDWQSGERGMHTAYSYSSTSSVLSSHVNDPSYIAGLSGDGRNNDTPSGYWKFPDITYARYANNVKTSTVGESARNLHLGYLGLADDDTPWRLRIVNAELENSDKLWMDYNQNIIKLRDEGGTQEHNIAIHIRATAACVNEPVKITLSDGEGGVVECTLYFTVISSPPVPLDCGNPNQSVLLCDGVEGVRQNNAYVSGLFRLFTVPSEEGGVYNIQGVGNHAARRVYDIALTNLATDPDGEAEINGMALYQDGQFTVNGERLVRNSLGRYVSDYFYVETMTFDNGLNGFRLTATGYNPDSVNGYEELTLRIADTGNGDFDNTLVITIHVYTTYSDVTNPTVGAKTDEQFDRYIASPDVVHVKSYDEYYVAGATVAASRYAYVDLHGNDGNDGNTASPIVDPDARNIGDQAYSARLYAFIDFDENGNIAALPAATLKTMFTRSAPGTFKLNENVDYSEYMIAGVLYDGSEIAISERARARQNAINGFASFSFVNSGSALDFIPVASTLGSENILLYVEVEKHMGVRQVYLRNDAVLDAGSLFRLDVKDSAPLAVAGTHSGEGRIGDTVSFKIFDADDPYGALFVDSDARDSVTVAPLADADYETALAGNSDLDWRADENRPRAIDITVDENNNVNIKINRRIDQIADGVYKPSVTFDIKLTGKDIVGLSADTTVTVTIHNTDITASASSSHVDEETGVGYVFDHAPDGTCTLDISVKYSQPLDVDVSAFVSDPDYITAAADTDSFRFTNVIEDISPYKALTDEALTVKWYQLDDDGTPNADVSRDIATVEPLGTLTHRTGIRVTALASVRSLTATVYLRIVDRAADPAAPTSGVLVRVNITVLNDAPYTLPGMEAQTVYMTGSDKATPKGKLFYIGDFVTDKNSTDVVGDEDSIKSDTYLRIFRQGTQPVTRLYSKINTSFKNTTGEDAAVDSTVLFLVSVPEQIDEALLQEYCDERGLAYDYKDTSNKYGQWFVVTPELGFYGEGSIDISVADGDVSTQYDSLTTTFRLNVHVIYDANETAGAMEEQTIACSKSKTFDIATLMPDIENKLDFDNETEDNSTFNQAAYYRIMSVSFQNESDGSLVALEQIEGTATWSMRAGNQITVDPIRVNVRIAAINSPEKTIAKHFMLNIIPNEAPKMRYAEITFRSKHGDEPDALRDLTGGSIKLEAWQLFEDPDDPQGSALRLVSAKSQVSSLVQVSLEQDENGVNRYVVIKFVGKGESEITIGVTDETGNVVNLSFLARNDDLPEASLWVRISASFEAHKVMWAVIIGCVVLLIIILIIIIAVICKRKRAREELEALLVSEMEIEEQMLKLAGSPSPTDYRSYGYLPPVDQPTQTMLDAGMTDAGAGLDALPPSAQDSGTALPPPTDDGTMPPEGGTDGQ